MGIALHRETRRFQPLPEGIALAELLRVFEDCHTPGRAQLVARLQNGEGRWVERAVTSIGILATGDLLMSLGDGADAGAVRFDDLIALLHAPLVPAKGRMLYATCDGGTTMLVCRGGHIVHRNTAEAYMTFVPVDMPQLRGQTQYRH